MTCFLFGWVAAVKGAVTALVQTKSFIFEWKFLAMSECCKLCKLLGTSVIKDEIESVKCDENGDYSNDKKHF